MQFVPRMHKFHTEVAMFRTMIRLDWCNCHLTIMFQSYTCQPQQVY